MADLASAVARDQSVDQSIRVVSYISIRSIPHISDVAALGSLDGNAFQYLKANSNGIVPRRCERCITSSSVVEGLDWCP
jgi:hypothetical protein